MFCVFGFGMFIFFKPILMILFSLKKVPLKFSFLFEVGSYRFFTITWHPSSSNRSKLFKTIFSETTGLSLLKVDLNTP